jgi:pyruvate,orthophosphate dikinase
MVKSTSRRIKSISNRAAGKAAPRKPAAPAKAPPKKPSANAPAKSKWVFGFGNGKAEGRADMRNLLGGKGAGLAEMANLGLPVPPGFTITTAVCTHYYENGNVYPKNLQEQVCAALAQVGRITGKTFGDGDNPLLVSVRPGARASQDPAQVRLAQDDNMVDALPTDRSDQSFGKAVLPR